MAVVRAEVTQAQLKVLERLAERDDVEPGEALVAAWWGRVTALAEYTERRKNKNSKFRPYAPLRAEEKFRSEVKEHARKLGIAPATKAKIAKGPPKAKAKAKAKAQTAEPVKPKVRKARKVKPKIDALDSPETTAAKLAQSAPSDGTIAPQENIE